MSRLNKQESATRKMAHVHVFNRAKGLASVNTCLHFKVRQKAKLKYLHVCKVICWRQFYANMISLMQFSLFSAHCIAMNSYCVRIKRLFSFPFHKRWGLVVGSLP